MKTLRTATIMAPGEFAKKKEEFDAMLEEPLEGQVSTEQNDPRKFTDDEAYDSFATTMSQLGVDG